MLRNLIVFSIIAVFMISLSGCVTTIKKADTELEGLKSQVCSLESQLQTKEEEINNLRCALAKTEGTALAFSAKTKPTTRMIQAALTSAGYNPGAIDGKMGKQTKEAILSFQKANNLVADGKVGPKTWALLRGYCNIKVK